MQHPRVELIPVQRQADPSTIAARQDVADRMGAMGHIDPAQGQVNTHTAGWQARISDAAFPVTSFAVEEAGGAVFVSLVIPVSALTVGEDPADDPVNPGRAAERSQMVMDRLNFAASRSLMPLGAQVAANAEVTP